MRNNYVVIRGYIMKLQMNDLTLIGGHLDLISSN